MRESHFSTRACRLKSQEKDPRILCRICGVRRKRRHLTIQYKISCFVVRIKKLITHFKQSNMKRKILQNCLKRKYEYRLGEFSNLSFVVFKVKGSRQLTELLSSREIVRHSEICQNV